MEAFPYVLGLSLTCFVLCYGLMHRPPWMWFLGWFCFFLIAAYHGFWLFSALLTATDAASLGYVFTYLVGILVLWVPTVVWWATRQHLFGLDGKGQPLFSNTEVPGCDTNPTQEITATEVKRLE